MDPAAITGNHAIGATVTGPSRVHHGPSRVSTQSALPSRVHHGSITGVRLANQQACLPPSPHRRTQLKCSLGVSGRTCSESLGLPQAVLVGRSLRASMRARAAVVSGTRKGPQGVER
eukprot:14132701-Alexandrium_andersonii.AAC.1